MVNKFCVFVFSSFLAFAVLSSCRFDSSGGSAKSSESESESASGFDSAFSSSSLIKDFFAVGEDKSITVKFAPFSSDYRVFLMDGTDDKEIAVSDVAQSGEKIEIPSGEKSYTFKNLVNANLDSDAGEINENPFYTYTLIVCDKDGNELERKTAQATASSYFECEENKTEQNFCWFFLSDPDSEFPAMAGSENFVRVDQGKLNISKKIKKIKGSEYKKVHIYNNPSVVSKIVNDNDEFVKSSEYEKLLEYLEEGEEIQWLSFFPAGNHFEVLGRIVKTAVEDVAENQGYAEVSEYSVETAEEISSLKEVFRLGTKIKTKGYYKAGDGGNAVYKISNRADYSFASLKTENGQWCNLVQEEDTLNLVSLGAGNCFQVKWENYEKWREFQAADRAQKEAEKNGGTSSEWEKFIKENEDWQKYKKNDDSERIREANRILENWRKDESQMITLFIPRGNYRIAGDIEITLKNYVLRGETSRRDINPDEIESFEKTYGIGDESGSENSGGTVLYTDNGNCGTLNILGPAENVLVEGITLESRELDSRRTYWHSVTDPQNGPFTDINYVGRGTCEKTMADEQWFSRQVQVSQCRNVTIRNCEFIITSHVRDKAVYPSNLENPSDLYDFGGDEYIYSASGAIPGNLKEINSGTKLVGYQANAYVEHCDLHTDKQFTSVTFFDSWHNVTVDDCLLYNMAGVFRGASMGFLDMFGGQCSDGTVKNSTLFHNCHDEQIGIFTLTKDAALHKDDECIDGIDFSGNKVYAMRDEHVDKAKTRVMVFSVGYDGAENIFNVNVSGNYFYAKNLPSKLFTFGGFSGDGRKNITVQNNTIELEDSGGFYMFETRPYVKIKGNKINLHSQKGYIGGNIFDCSNFDESGMSCPEFSRNTINVQGDYTGTVAISSGNYSNGKAVGNTINISGNQTSTLFNGISEVRNNRITISGRLKEIYANRGTLLENVCVDGNVIETYFNDYEDDYTAGVPGSFFQSGREGFTFATVGAKLGSGNEKVFITNNRIEAPNCTRINKHFLRYTSPDVPVAALNNTVQKFSWLRGLSSENESRLVFMNNYDNYGNRLEKSDWFTDGLLNDTDKILFCYDEESDSYEMRKIFFGTGKIEVPDFYDDGNHGKRTVGIIGENCANGKQYISGLELSFNIKEIKSGAFDSCGLGKELFIPASVERIGSLAFGNTKSELTIKCEASEKPDGWKDDWFSGDAKIEWNVQD